MFWIIEKNGWTVPKEALFHAPEVLALWYLKVYNTEIVLISSGIYCNPSLWRIRKLFSLWNTRTKISETNFVCYAILEVLSEEVNKVQRFINCIMRKISRTDIHWATYVCLHPNPSIIRVTLHWVFEGSVKSAVLKFLKQNRCKQEISRIFKDSLWLVQLTDLDANEALFNGLQMSLIFCFKLFCLSGTVGLRIFVGKVDVVFCCSVYSCKALKASYCTFVWIFWKKLHSKASKLHQLCFGALSSFGVRGHLTHQKNALMAASEISVFEMSTKCCFLQNIQSFSILFTQFHCIERKKFIEGIFSLTNIFWKQLILLNEVNFFKIKFLRFLIRYS